MWFKNLTGFNETSPEYVRQNLTVEENKLISKVNGKSYSAGYLEVPTLEHLKSKAPDLNTLDGNIKISQITGDIKPQHTDPDNKNALFQAASQFNLLEMISPGITPEDGIDRYEKDHTQGPACAISCGAGTIYRNYFAVVNGRIGQSQDNQIDCLELIGKELKNEELSLWKMTNGYALPSAEGLKIINAHLEKLSFEGIENLKNKLKIGIQWNTEVTISDQKQIVSQAYCSALPVLYSGIDRHHFEKFARLILEATYEATLYAGLINYQNTGSKKVFLTSVGGGAFGNEPEWILDSMRQALVKFKNSDLDIKIVSYSQRNSQIDRMITEIQ